MPIVFQLAPGPAFLGRFVNHHALAEQGFAVEPRVMRWCAAKGGGRLNDLMAPAFNKPLGLDLTLQMLRCDLRSKRIYAGIEGDHVSVSFGTCSESKSRCSFSGSGTK